MLYPTVSTCIQAISTAISRRIPLYLTISQGLESGISQKIHARGGLEWGVGVPWDCGSPVSVSARGVVVVGFYKIFV